MMQYGDSGTAYDQMDEFTFDEIARALVYEKTGYALPALGSLDPEWQLYRDWLAILNQAAYSKNGGALEISIYEDDPKQNWYVQRKHLIKWCESRNLRPRFLFPLAKVGAGGTANGDQAQVKGKEPPQQRRERLQKRCNELKAQGVKAWQKQTASEEGITASRLKVILSDGDKVEAKGGASRHCPPFPVATKKSNVAR